MFSYNLTSINRTPTSQVHVRNAMQSLKLLVQHPCINFDIGVPFVSILPYSVRTQRVGLRLNTTLKVTENYNWYRRS